MGVPMIVLGTHTAVRNPYLEVQSMKKFYAYRVCAALSAIAAVVVASGAGQKWG
jgi:hypothetical protein